LKPIQKKISNYDIINNVDANIIKNLIDECRNLPDIRKNAYNKYESKLQVKMELLSKQLQDIKNDYEKKLIVAYKTTNENIARQVRSEFLKKNDKYSKL